MKLKLLCIVFCFYIQISSSTFVARQDTFDWTNIPCSPSDEVFSLGAQCSVDGACSSQYLATSFGLSESESTFYVTSITLSMKLNTNNTADSGKLKLSLLSYDEKAMKPIGPPLASYETAELKHFLSTSTVSQIPFDVSLSSFNLLPNRKYALDVQTIPASFVVDLTLCTNAFTSDAKDVQIQYSGVSTQTHSCTKVNICDPLGIPGLNCTEDYSGCTSDPNGFNSASLKLWYQFLDLKISNQVPGITTGAGQATSGISGSASGESSATTGILSGDGATTGSNETQATSGGSASSEATSGVSGSDVTTGIASATTGLNSATTDASGVTTSVSQVDGTTGVSVTTGQNDVTTGNAEVTTGSVITTASEITTGVPEVTTSVITTGASEITTGQPSVTTGPESVTTGEVSVTTGSVITTGSPASVTTASPESSGIPTQLTTGVEDGDNNQQGNTGGNSDENSKSSGGLSLGTKIAIAICVILAALGLLAMLIFIIVKKRKPKYENLEMSQVLVETADD